MICRRAITSNRTCLIKFLLDKEFCAAEKIDRRLLLIETILFYGYYAAMIYELLVLHSYFLLVFHMVPSLLIAVLSNPRRSDRALRDRQANSWDSNGIFDPKKLTGLFRVSIWFNSLLSDHFSINHGIHHAYPPLPLSIINKEYAALPRTHPGALRQCPASIRF